MDPVYKYHCIGDNDVDPDSDSVHMVSLNCDRLSENQPCMHLASFEKYKL